MKYMADSCSLQKASKERLHKDQSLIAMYTKTQKRTSSSKELTQSKKYPTPLRNCLDGDLSHIILGILLSTVQLALRHSLPAAAFRFGLEV